MGPENGEIGLHSQLMDIAMALEPRKVQLAGREFPYCRSHRHKSLVLARMPREHTYLSSMVNYNELTFHLLNIKS